MEWYRVAFKSAITGYKNHDSWFQSKSFCQKWVDFGNEALRGIIQHYVESYAESINCKIVKRKRRKCIRL